MSSHDEDSSYHIPVLRDRAIDLVLTRPDGIYVDGTLGGGGHTAALLARLDAHGRVFGFDQDADALRHCAQRFATDPRLTLIHENVAQIGSVLAAHEVKSIDGLLLDLGVSSHQIDIPERGFSFRFDGPLDMRMNHDATMTAAELIATSSEAELARILFTYGEERQSRRIARALAQAGSIESTSRLREVVTAVVSPAHVNKTLARVFQALRIAVNNELDVLERTLRDALDLLAVGGRLVVISYHSLEDRMVKLFLRQAARNCVCPPTLPVCVCGTVARVKILTTRHIEADDDEVRGNQRARSARLRAGEKIHA